MGHLLDKDDLWIITHGDEIVADEDSFWELVKRRESHEPIEYITGKVSFYSETFFIAPGALIPRPETELLIERVLEKTAADFSGHVVEIGVGSGIISVILAMKLPKARFSAVDISADALKIAKKNIEKFGLQSRIRLYEGDLLSPIEEPIDILVSNPPYIEDGLELDRCLDYEPQNALYGGKVGDEILIRIIDEAQKRQIPLVACEMGYDQKQRLQNYVKIKGFYSVTFYKDLADLDRGFVLERV